MQVHGVANAMTLSKLKEELLWLEKVEVPSCPCPSSQIMLADHLQHCREHFACAGVDKIELGHDLGCQLLSSYLFPASSLVLDPKELNKPGIIKISPKCNEVRSRVAAYQLLVELCTGCYGNFAMVAKELVTIHHTSNPNCNFQPHSAGFVGLKNLGATGYINCILQQLFMITSFRETILSWEKHDEQDNMTVLAELQRVFRHLLMSDLQSYSPDEFLETFKLWGKTIDVRRPDDACDFFKSLLYQVDEQLESPQQMFIFEILDQKVCQSCGHTYNNGGPCLFLDVSTKSKKLEDGLSELVKRNVITYSCEKCRKRREIFTRICLKTLPPVLVLRLHLHLHLFEFPWLLDMTPYTTKGIARAKKGLKPKTGQQHLYDLVGVVVLSELEDEIMPRYYSFIKDKRSETSHSIPGRWLRFYNDLVEECTPEDVLAESFGGNYNPMTRKAHYTKNRGAYMLFYEALKTPAESGSAPSLITKFTPKDQLKHIPLQAPPPHAFPIAMPADVQRSKNEENLRSMQHREVYCQDYFEFIYRLTKCNVAIIENLQHPQHAAFGVTSMELATNFLFHTYFRAQKKLRMNLDVWVQNLEHLISSCKEACSWFMKLLASPTGTGYLKIFLLKFTNREVRQGFCKILSHAVITYSSLSACSAVSPIDVIVDTLLRMLEKNVGDNSKFCAEYFKFFRRYSSHPRGCRHLLDKDAFTLMVKFFLGFSPEVAKPNKAQPRRWDSTQGEEFRSLHCTLSVLIRNVDISGFESTTESSGFMIRISRFEFSTESSGVNPYRVPLDVNELLPPSDGIHQLLFVLDCSKRFITECVLALGDSDTATCDAIASTLCYCSWNNATLSAITIENLQQRIAAVSSYYEISNHFKVLTEILLIHDSLQEKRIKFAIGGGIDIPHISIFNSLQTTHKADLKVYQGIKFLMGLTNKSRYFKEYLLSNATYWKWTLQWLRQKMPAQSSSASTASQRTLSAQESLEEAEALLSELDNRM